MLADTLINVPATLHIFAGTLVENAQASLPEGCSLAALLAYSDESKCLQNLAAWPVYCESPCQCQPDSEVSVHARLCVCLGCAFPSHASAQLSSLPVELGR